MPDCDAGITLASPASTKLESAVELRVLNAAFFTDGVDLVVGQDAVPRNENARRPEAKHDSNGRSPIDCKTKFKENVEAIRALDRLHGRRRLQSACRSFSPAIRSAQPCSICAKVPRSTVA